MSSVLLYLAIVIMWLCVLVPMWLRRDRATFVELHEGVEPYVHDEQMEADEPTEAHFGAMRPSASSMSPPASPAVSSPLSHSVSQSVSEVVSPPEADEVPDRTLSAGPIPGTRRAAAERRRAEQRRRAVRVAKRRRLTLWCVLLILASVVTAAVQVMPWWGVAPSVIILGFYLAVLRVSAQIDAERRRAAAQARAERARRARRRAELEARQPVAEIIDLAAHRDELFDQYAEAARRAVGD